MKSPHLEIIRLPVRLPESRLDPQGQKRAPGSKPFSKLGGGEYGVPRKINVFTRENIGAINDWWQNWKKDDIAAHSRLKAGT
jgi:hypothetical protein